MTEVLDVLRRGPGANPDPSCRTRQNETVLGLESSVYVYLGKTVPDFGDAAFAFPLDGLDGNMSPFDSGGLVAHIRPVSEREEADKRAFLSSFTFATRFRRKLIKDYPGNGRAPVKAYLEGKRPRAKLGPHEVWPKAAVTDPAIAAIWHNGNNWKAWTWEGRSTKHLPVSGNLVRWSCAATMYEKIREYGEGAAPPEAKFVESLLRTYARGGVSQLVSDLRAGQLP